MIQLQITIVIVMGIAILLRRELAQIRSIHNHIRNLKIPIRMANSIKMRKVKIAMAIIRVMW